MDKVLSISFGELFLKGGNRKNFINQARGRIRNAIKNLAHGNIYLDMGKLFVEYEDGEDDLIKAVQKVFGIATIIPCIRVNKELEMMDQAVLEEMKAYAGQGKTFKSMVNRADKSFEPKSPEMNMRYGGLVLKNLEGFSVDVHQPEIELFVDIRERVYISTTRFSGMGGLPIGSSGKGLVLLSGGIDSSVAAFQIGKRGVQLSALHFHSFPFTSERAQDKVVKLAEILSGYLGRIKMYSVNILPIQKVINENCNPREMTILSRRFMMRIGEEISQREGYPMLVTGESLGQVASQTIEGIHATNSVVNRPVLRPLIAMDKTEIIEIADFIETYETSVLPYDDCCTVFLPKSPVIKPRIEDLEYSESLIDVQGLVEEAVDNLEIIEIGY